MGTTDDRRDDPIAESGAVQIGVVVVHWNSPALLLDCLRHLRLQSRPPDAILVVDNASQAFDEAGLRRRFPGVELARLDENRGFAGGANQGARLLPHCDWIAFLNPDAHPEPGWLAALASASLRYPEAGALASQMHKLDTADRLDGTGDLYHISGRVWRRDEGCPVRASEREEGEVFSACGGTAIYRGDVFRALGGFDERFFCYLEDVDLGFRLRLAGYRCIYVPDARVRHLGSAVTKRGSDFSVYYGHRNLVWTFVKNMPGPLLWALLPYHLLLNLATLVHFAARGRGAILWQAKRDALRDLPRALEQRRAIQARRRATLNGIWRVLEKGRPWPRCRSGTAPPPEARGQPSHRRRDPP